MIVLPSLLTPARAAGVNATVNRTSISITMNFQVTQNLTISLPTFNIALDQSSPIAQQIQNGFRTKAPGAQIDQMNLQARSAEINNNTGTWIFQENYTMTVSGVTTNTGGRIIADLSFLTTRNNQSMTVTNQGKTIDLNNVGQAYLLAGFQRFPPATNTKYFGETSEFTLPLIPEQFTQGFSILDLSWVKPFTWSGGYQPFQSSTIWSYVPRQLPYNVTIGVGQTTEGTFLKEYTAFLDSSVQISAPPGAQISGTTVTFDIPTNAETIMPIIILIAVAVGISAFIIERRVSKSARSSKARKR